jgi:hypothetical protein
MRLGHLARPRTPLLHEVDQVFAPIDRFIDQLKAGEVYCDSTGCTLFQDNEGNLYEAGPAVLGFAEVWEKLAQKFALNVDTVTLYQWANRLKYNMPIDPVFVAQLERSIDGIRSAYRSMDVFQTKSVVRTEEIRIKCEELGLIDHGVS